MIVEAPEVHPGTDGQFARILPHWGKLPTREIQICEIGNIRIYS